MCAQANKIGIGARSTEVPLSEIIIILTPLSIATSISLTIEFKEVSSPFNPFLIS